MAIVLWEERGIEYARQLFLYSYIVFLPLVLSGIVNIYKLLDSLGRHCFSGERFDKTILAIGFLPLGIPILLYATTRSIKYCKLYSGRPGASIVEPIFIIATLGLHGIFYSIFFERLIDYIVLRYREYGR